MTKPFSANNEDIKHWILPEVNGRVVGAEKGENLRPQTVEDIEAVYEEGRKKGYEAGFEQARTEIEKVTRMIKFLKQPLREMDDQVELQLTELAMTLARMLLKKECYEDSAHIQQLVHESLEFLPVQSRNIRVHLNPADIKIMQKSGVDPMTQDWKCVEDAKITQGGCKVDSEQSHIDASVETRIQQLVDQLNEHVPQQGGRVILTHRPSFPNV